MPVALSELMLKARQPAVERACEFLPVVERERQIARRVAFAAMRQRFGEIGAADSIPAVFEISGSKRVSGLNSADQKIMAQRWLNGKISVLAGGAALAPAAG